MIDIDLSTLGTTGGHVPAPKSPKTCPEPHKGNQKETPK
jgi:hypothetical protein